MTIDQQNQHDTRLEAAVEDLQALIAQHYPTGRFSVGVGEDPPGTCVTAIVNVADPDAVVDVFIERLLELQIEAGLPLYVVPVRHPERVTEAIAARQTRHPVPGVQTPLGQ